MQMMIIYRNLGVGEHSDVGTMFMQILCCFVIAIYTWAGLRHTDMFISGSKTKGKLCVLVTALFCFGCMLLLRALNKTINSTPKDVSYGAIIPAAVCLLGIIVVSEHAGIHLNVGVEYTGMTYDCIFAMVDT